ncbi:ribosomal protein S18 acetylase RimI-like enzyme [Solibacillus kalamii]|uniref:GNAT family N-acetyltransferase n=1 Tax=Solibacillus kalamii TaxID=1748298 RepID=A0ABX3ZEF7_9BACL|nr:GNAT family N-acetyltransferase [Solibacillus kalamii]MBM7666328.1 ribosomal protein S18 acetylase RimI-like enzyme [Solibacillus kalamii]OUZ38081.1 GNAT family N-acetyltransferase [Solibacillus kalamii]
MELRLATTDDMEILIDLRKRLLVEEGQTVSSNIDEELRNFFEKQLNSGQFVQWIIEEDKNVLATGGIQFISFPPSYSNSTGIRGYILNMYTTPESRGRGLAKQLVERIFKEAQGRNVHHIFLISSPMGKPLYKKIGFNENDIYMEYFIN